MSIYFLSVHRLVLAFVMASVGGALAIGLAGLPFTSITSLIIFVIIVYLVVIYQFVMVVITNRNIILITHGLIIPRITKLSLETITSILIKRFEKNVKQVQEIGEASDDEIEKSSSIENKIVWSKEGSEDYSLEEDGLYILLMNANQKKFQFPIYLLQNPNQALANIVKKLETKRIRLD